MYIKLFMPGNQSFNRFLYVSLTTHPLAFGCNVY